MDLFERYKLEVFQKILQLLRMFMKFVKCFFYDKFVALLVLDDHMF